MKKYYRRSTVEGRIYAKGIAKRLLPFPHYVAECKSQGKRPVAASTYRGYLRKNKRNKESKNVSPLFSEPIKIPLDIGGGAIILEFKGNLDQFRKFLFSLRK